MADSRVRVNTGITSEKVRLVGPDGDQIGVKTLSEALAAARSADMDLVEVAGKANPPVCRIMDYSKFKYESSQKQKESRKKSSHVVVKEMKYRPKIGQGDFDTKTRKVNAFLDEGNRVKVTIMFRGREVQHPELGMKILDQVIAETEEIAQVETPPSLEGRNMSMILIPGKKTKKSNSAPKQKNPAEVLKENPTEQNTQEQT